MTMKLPKVGVQDLMKDGHKVPFFFFFFLFLFLILIVFFFERSLKKPSTGTFRQSRSCHKLPGLHLDLMVFFSLPFSFSYCCRGKLLNFFSSSFYVSFSLTGKNKMIVNHLDKLFVTNDAATMLKEMDIIHPACKVLVLGSDQQQKEVGDSTNFVIVFGGELLQKAEALLKMGLTQTEISDGFNKACKKALEELDCKKKKQFFLLFFFFFLLFFSASFLLFLLPTNLVPFSYYYLALVVKKVEDISSREQLLMAVKSVIASKQVCFFLSAFIIFFSFFFFLISSFFSFFFAQYGYEEFLSPLVVDACLSVMPSNPRNFNVDNVRVVKIMGASLLDSRVIRGMVFGREPESTYHHYSLFFGLIFKLMLFSFF
jgi:hypothetical protein